jgi:hypothetical protein
MTPDYLAAQYWITVGALVEAWTRRDSEIADVLDRKVEHLKTLLELAEVRANGR